MKFKTVAISALILLLSTSCVYAASDDDANSAGTRAPSNENIGNPSAQPNATPTMPNSSSTDSNTNDDVSADTATGDDDY
jgi:hypothetical protein